LKLWKMKPIFSLRSLRARVVVELEDVDAVQLVGAVGVLFEQAGDVEEGGLARARRPGHGDELAGLDRQRQVAQRMGFHQCGAEDFAEVLHVEHGAGSLGSLVM
jgi:hypothetical protein